MGGTDDKGPENLQITVGRGDWDRYKEIGTFKVWPSLDGPAEIVLREWHIVNEDEDGGKVTVRLRRKNAPALFTKEHVDWVGSKNSDPMGDFQRYREERASLPTDSPIGGTFTLEHGGSN